MSAKRPARRYVGLTFEPTDASRKDVARAVEEAWAQAGAPAGAPAPRLLVCEGGRAIIAVPRDLALVARRAADHKTGLVRGIQMSAVVTSGTVASVKARLGVKRKGRERA